MGISLAKELSRDQQDVVLIEQDEDRLGKATASLDVEILIGNGCDPKVLLEAGIEEADFLLAVAHIDEINIAACCIARMLNPNTKRIGRIRNVNLFHEAVSAADREDLFHLIVNPDQAAAEHIADLLKVPGARESVDFCAGKLRLLALDIREDSPLAHKLLSDLAHIDIDFPVVILALVRDDKLIVPCGKDRVLPGDVVYFLSIPEKTALLFEVCGHTLVKGRRAMIWGENNIARHLLEQLSDLDIACKIIVSNEDEAEKFLDIGKHTLVFIGQGTDQELLLEENIAEVDAFVAVTPDEENNILGALLAKRLGAATTMAVVNKATYLSLVQAIGVDVVVSARLAAATAIFQQVHKRKSHIIANEFSLRHLGAGFIEITLSENSPIAGKMVKDIHPPRGVLFSAIVRGENILIPHGETQILAGDQLVVFVTSTAHKALEKLLNVKMEFFL